MSTKKVSLLKGTSIVSALTLISRVCGLIRDLLIARYLGAGWRTDAFFVAFRIPNLLRALVAEGALTSAFVPVFSSELREGMDQARRTFRIMSGLLLLITCVLSLIGIFFSPQIVGLLAPGFQDAVEQYSLCVSLTKIMFPYIIFVSLVSLCNGALNSLNIFGAAPIAQITMNVTLIIGALCLPYFDSLNRVYILSCVVLFGGVVQILSQRSFLIKAGLSLRPGSTLWSRATKEVGLLMVPAVGGAAVYQLSLFFTTILASVLPIGSVSWLFYADRISQLPIGLFTVALSSVLLPALSHSASSNQGKEFTTSFLNSLRFTSFLLIPISVGILFYAEPLVSLFFERGEFTAYARVQTAHAVQAMCFGIWGISCTSLTMRAFIARKDTITPTIFAVVNVSFIVLTALWLMGEPVRLQATSWIQWLFSLQAILITYLPEYSFAHVGLAVSTGIVSMTTFPLALFVLERRGLPLDLYPFFFATLRALIGSLVMYAVLLHLPDAPYQWLTIMYGTICGIVSYALMCILLRSQEWKECIQTLRRLIS